jgi:hypothetical protein
MKRIFGSLYEFSKSEKYPIKVGMKKVQEAQEFALMSATSDYFVPIRSYEARVLKTLIGTRTFYELATQLKKV